MRTLSYTYAVPSYSILKTLKAFREDRRHKQGAEQKKEEREWKELWGDLGYDLLLHAAKYGSPEAVQIVFDIVQDCNLQLYVCHNQKH